MEPVKLADNVDKDNDKHGREDAVCDGIKCAKYHEDDVLVIVVCKLEEREYGCRRRRAAVVESELPASGAPPDSEDGFPSRLMREKGLFLV